MVEINEYINFIKVVGLARDQFGGVAVIGYLQNMGRGHRYYSGVSSMDFQHTVENNAVRRHTFHNPNMH